MSNNNFAVIFDMDGVLVDNSAFHQRAFKEFFQEIGGKEFTVEMFGRSNKDIMRYLFPEITDEKVLEYAEGKEAYYREIYKPHMKPHGGLIELLNELKTNGIKIAVGSSAPTENIDFVLDGLNIRHYFDEVVNSAKVERAKPHPDIYLKAAALLGMEPAKCIVFEDAIAGIEAARSAGMKVIGVATTLPFEQLNHTDEKINDFTSVNFNTINNLMK